MQEIRSAGLWAIAQALRDRPGKSVARFYELAGVTAYANRGCDSCGPGGRLEHHSALSGEDEFATNV